jgi:hypothetical protein
MRNLYEWGGVVEEGHFVTFACDLVIIINK